MFPKLILISICLAALLIWVISYAYQNAGKESYSRRDLARFVSASPEKIVRNNLTFELLMQEEEYTTMGPGLPRRPPLRSIFLWANCCLIKVEYGWMIVSGEYRGERDGILLHTRYKNWVSDSLCSYHGPMVEPVVETDGVHLLVELRNNSLVLQTRRSYIMKFHGEGQEFAHLLRQHNDG